MVTHPATALPSLPVLVGDGEASHDARELEDTMKNVPTHAAISLMSGKLIPPPDRSSNGFSDMHELAEHVAGCAVFNTMFASEPFVDVLRNRLQPHLPSTVIAASDRAAVDLASSGVDAMLRATDAFVGSLPTIAIPHFEPLPDTVMADAFLSSLA